MTGVVTATGNQTFFGRTAKLVASAGAKSHSQQAVSADRRFPDPARRCAGAGPGRLPGLSRHRRGRRLELGRPSASIAQFVLVLLVASIPVAMPAVMSVTMALGALALSKQKAIVSRLSAIEELAGVDVLCSDKTGTLTMNQLTLDQPIPFGAAKPDDVVFAAALASAAQQRGRDRQRRARRRLKDPAALDQVQADRIRAVRSGQQAHRGDRDGCAGQDASTTPRARRRRSPTLASPIRSRARKYRRPGRRTRRAAATGRWAWRSSGRRQDLDAGGPPVADGSAAPRRQGDHRRDRASWASRSRW